MNGDDGPHSSMEVRLFYLVGVSQFYEDTNSFISLKNTSNIPVGNGSSFKALVIKLTRRFINITMIETSASVV
jgi:hypothetical protein